jgi:hypothetical protein
MNRADVAQQPPSTVDSMLAISVSPVRAGKEGMAKLAGAAFRRICDIPSVGLDLVLRNALALVVHRAKHALRGVVPLVGGPAKPE